ncbi:MAG: ZIP family metal transporter [Sinomicrobium sp.]|nr:ZIP family metal transporter [Sinomicrobium sp.]
MDYILPIVAVLSGFLFVLTVRPKEKKKLRLLLAFSGAFLLSLTVFSLLPEIYGGDLAEEAGMFIMLGILLQIFLEFFSKGAEHGHVHLHKHRNVFPWLLFISLSIHSVLEGFPVYGHHNLVYGIVVHKLPIAIILSTFFLEASVKKRYVFVFLLLFSLMTPLGTLLAEHVTWLRVYSRQIAGLVVGIFLHISTIILFESSEGHKFNIRKLIVIVIGIVAAYFV